MKLMRLLSTLLLPCFCIGAIPARAETSASQGDATAKVHFNRDVRPILAATCFQCHGPDQNQRESDLRLDEEEGVRSAFGTGNLEDSEAWRRIVSADPDDRMPPPDSHQELTAVQRETLRQWLLQGAEWQGHWAFVAPQRPAIPDLPDWVAVADRPGKNPIDCFILARLDQEALRPNEPADRERLLRRVTFDLTGLAPTLQEIDAFLKDTSTNAYEKVVDRLLSSARFGERMAVAWLDAARYGDTSVFHGDGPRDMWAWRDWVINAYNSNKPFDRFTVEQLAGDLIPDATVEQQIASGFNRNNATTDEGGAIAEEFRVEYAVDRVKTTSMVWLGLTMECAQCHEHKYDPITQEEYYRFFAYFNQASDPGMQTRNGNTAPVANVPNYELRSQLAAIRQELRRVQADLDARRSAAEEPFNTWRSSAEQQRARESFAPTDMLAYFDLDETEGTTVKDRMHAEHAGKIEGVPKRDAGKIERALQFESETYVDLGDLAGFERSDAFSYGAWVHPAGKVDGAPLSRMKDAQQQRGYDLLLANGHVQVHLVHDWDAKNAIKVSTKKKLSAGAWQHVFVTYDGNSKAAGLKVYVNGELWETNVEQDGLTETIRTDAPFLLGRRNPSASYTGLLDEVRVFSRELSDKEVRSLVKYGHVDLVLAKSADARSPQESEFLRRFYLEHEDPVYQQLSADLAAVQAREAVALKPRGSVMVMGDVDKPRMTYVLARGDYASPQKDQAVKPGVPSILPALPEGASQNRLGLANWLVQDQHPLTPRVAVNRYWLMLFGYGLVKSAEDFGAQGEWPSHPALLDWMAVDFVENGWDIKRTIKQILMSATYRQSSRGSADAYEADPENRLLARGPRFRLQGEFIRDHALAISELLVGSIGGPSTKPYQPDGLWNEVSINTNLRFKQDHGKKLYRRSMYIYWKRSAPPPTMAIFDAPSREKCTIRRSRTNTPLQALVTLNDPQFVEASRALAQRVIKTGGQHLEQQVATAYRLATGTRPSNAVLEVLVQAYRQELKVFREQTERATALLAIGESKRDESIDAAEHAAMTVVSTMILNLDETLTRG